MRKTVSVYGYGRFGKFWADLLKEEHNVKVFSRRGLQPEEVNEGVSIADENEIFECDAMFFCVSISAFELVLKEQKEKFKKEVLYFDTCSVKMKPVEWMKEYLPTEASIIATHPMFGPDSYFESKTYLPMMMSNIQCNRNIFEEWVAYFANKKMRVEVMTPEHHDKQVAYSQGITHYVGRVLADLNLKKSDIDTLGYRKMLEVTEQTCNDSWQLFVDLQKYNPYTQQMREELFSSIEKIYEKLK